MPCRPPFVALAAAALLIAGQARAQELAEGWDFIPGEKLLLYDDFSDMPKGGTPPHWKVRGASVKLRADGKLLVTQETRLWPNVQKWPKNFTIEQEFTLEKGDAERYITWSFGGPEEDWQWRLGVKCFDADLVCRISLEGGEGDLGKADDLKYAFGQPNTFNLWVQDNRIRVYFNKERVIDVNQVQTAPWTTAWLWIVPEEVPITLSRVRIAESSPDFSKTIMATGRFVTHGIQFDVNSDRLRPESAPVLKMVADAMSSDPSLKLRIEGHTDSTGDAARNLELSRRRAESVKNALVTRSGIGADRLTTEGFGQTKPISPNDTPQGRANNRRVEFARL